MRGCVWGREEKRGEGNGFLPPSVASLLLPSQVATCLPSYTQLSKTPPRAVSIFLPFPPLFLSPLTCTHTLLLGLASSFLSTAGE